MTLRANELRIGNIVNDPSGFGPMIVEAINPSPGRVYLRSMDGEYLGDFDINKIEGMALTEEFLLKKVNWRGYNDLYFNSNFCLDTMKHLYYHGDYTGVNVPFIHSLQNLYFALTGEELTLANHPV